MKVLRGARVVGLSPLTRGNLGADMTPKPPTVAQLKRKIEKLEAEVEMLRRFRQIDAKTHNEYAYRALEAETRVKQAIAILNGETD